MSTAAGSSSRPSCSPSWPSRAPSGSPAGSPATGGRTSWLTTRATVGYDVVNRTDVQFFPTGQVADYLQNRDGRPDRQPVPDLADLGGPGGHRPLPALARPSAPGPRSAASSSATCRRHLRHRPRPAGRAPRPSPAPASPRRADTTIESRSLGSYVEEEISIKERLFVTGALRFDDNSAFGENFDATVYPKASVSWLRVRRAVLQHRASLNTFRLRGAFGVSGQQPGTTDALRFFNPVAGKRGGPATHRRLLRQPRATPDLKPERSRELELGLDAATVQGPSGARVHLLQQDTPRMR